MYKRNINVIALVFASTFCLLMLSFQNTFHSFFPTSTNSSYQRENDEQLFYHNLSVTFPFAPLSPFAPSTLAPWQPITQVNSKHHAPPNISLVLDPSSPVDPPPTDLDTHVIFIKVKAIYLPPLLCLLFHLILSLFYNWSWSYLTHVGKKLWGMNALEANVTQDLVPLHIGKKAVKLFS